MNGRIKEFEGVKLIAKDIRSMCERDIKSVIKSVAEVMQ
jgi:hypothetical protein